MRPSNYNFFFPIEEEKVLAYNTFTNGLAVIDCELKNKIIKKTFAQIDRDVLIELKKGGFIIPKEKNELDILKIKYRRIQYNSDYMNMTIAPTMDCNMACKYCFETLEDKEKKVMDRKVVAQLIKFMKKNIRKNTSTFHVTWFGGEPLLEPEIIEELSQKFMRICENKKIKYQSSIVTNGTLLNEKNAVMLKKCKVLQAQVTIDGPEMIHNARRPYSNGQGTFQDIMNNLKKVLEIIPISLRVNIDKKNMAETERFFSFITSESWYNPKKLHIYYGHVGKYTDSCKCQENDMIDTNLYLEKSLELKKYLVNKGEKWDFFPSLAGGCDATSLYHFLVGPSGELYKCWNHIGDDSKIIGTIFNEEIELSEVFLKCLLLGFENDKQCQKCKILPICMGGCVNLRMLHEEGKIGFKDCTFWKYNLKKAIYDYYYFNRSGNGSTPPAQLQS